MAIPQRISENVAKVAGELNDDSGRVVVGIPGGYVHYGECVKSLEHDYTREKLYLLCVGAYAIPGRDVYVVFRLGGVTQVIKSNVDFKAYLPFKNLISTSRGVII